MGDGGEDVLLTWSSKVEELIDEEKTREAITLLNGVIARLETLDDAHSNLTLAAACNDIGRLYAKDGFSIKADSFFTRAFLIKQRTQQNHIDNFRTGINETSRKLTNEENENPKGITDTEASKSFEEVKYGTSHVLVVGGFSPKIPTRELEHLFEGYANQGVVIRRVNDTVALAVFRKPASAREALKSIHSQYNIRALDDGDSLLSSLSTKDLEPPFPRPPTSAKTAQRIIMGALQSQGLLQKAHVKSSYNDIKIQEEERRNRIHMRQKLRDEAWGSDD